MKFGLLSGDMLAYQNSRTFQDHRQSRIESCKSGNISEVMQDSNVVTIHYRIAVIPMTLSDLEGHPTTFSAGICRTAAKELT